MATANIPTIKNIQEYDDTISLSTPNLFPSIDEQESQLSNLSESELFSWLLLLSSIGILLLTLVLLTVIAPIVFLLIRRRRQSYLQPVTTHV